MAKLTRARRREIRLAVRRELSAIIQNLKLNEAGSLNGYSDLEFEYACKVRDETAAMLNPNEAPGDEDQD